MIPAIVVRGADGVGLVDGNFHPQSHERPKAASPGARGGAARAGSRQLRRG